MWQEIEINGITYFTRCEVHETSIFKVFLTDLSRCWIGTHTPETALKVANDLNGLNLSASELMGILQNGTVEHYQWEGIELTFVYNHSTYKSMKFMWLIECSSLDKFQEIVMLPVFKMMHIQLENFVQLSDAIRSRDMILHQRRNNRRTRRATSEYHNTINSRSLDELKKLVDENASLMAYMKVKFNLSWPGTSEPRRATPNQVPQQSSTVPTATASTATVSCDANENNQPSCSSQAHARDMNMNEGYLAPADRANGDITWSDDTTGNRALLHFYLEKSRQLREEYRQIAEVEMPIEQQHQPIDPIDQQHQPIDPIDQQHQPIDPIDQQEAAGSAVVAALNALSALNPMPQLPGGGNWQAIWESLPHNLLQTVDNNPTVVPSPSPLPATSSDTCSDDQEQRLFSTESTENSE